jgi:hypothetical protein
VIAASAAAPTPGPVITLDRPCYVRTGPAPPPLTITGSGFSAGDPVAITDRLGTLHATGTVDASGALLVTVPGPGLVLRHLGEVRDTIIVTDRTPAGATLVARAPTFVSILGAGHGATPAARGLRSLRARTTWAFSGWPTDRTIFVHYLVGGRAVARQAFGRPAAPCGTLTIVRPLFPGTPHVADYRTQIDTHRHFSVDSRPRFDRLRVGLRLRFSPGRS